MAVNQYFTPMTNTATQDYIETMIIQSIQANGLDMMYLPRDVLENDDVFDEALHTRFDSKYDLEFVVEDIMNFNGQGHSFMAGFQMDDSITLVCSKSRFTEVIGAPAPVKKDVIYIKEADMMWQVTNVLEDEDWRQWGKNYVWRLKCTRFMAGHEEFDTEEDIFDNDIEELMDGDPANWETGTPLFPDDTSGQASAEETSSPDIDIDFGERK